MTGAALREWLEKLARFAQRPGTAGEGKTANAALQRLFAPNPGLRADALIGIKIKFDR